MRVESAGALARPHVQEAVQALGPAADSGAEAMVAAAAKRAGEVSTAGRSSPLSIEADRTLAAVVACLSEPKVAHSTRT